jgi:hypothetical protein
MPILISSTQLPGNGGSATNAMNMIYILRDLGFSEVYGMFLDYNTETVVVDPKIMYLQRKKGNVNKGISDYRKVLMEFMGQEPQLIMARNYITPFILKKCFPTTTTIYFVSGSKSCSKSIATNPRFLSEIDMSDLEEDKMEKQAMDTVDLITVNSMVTRRVFEHQFPNISTKLLPDIHTSYISGIFTHLSNADTTMKEFDLVICISRFDRVIKNGQLAFDVCRHPKLSKLTKLLIGDLIPSDLANDTSITIVPQIPNEELLTQWLPKCKVLMMPSFYDSSSNILHEAMGLGLSTVGSGNIGSHDKLTHCVQNTNNLDEWVDAVTMSVDGFGSSGSRDMSWMYRICVNISLVCYVVGMMREHNMIPLSEKDMGVTRIIIDLDTFDVGTCPKITQGSVYVLNIYRLFDLPINQLKRHVVNQITKVLDIIPRKQLRVQWAHTV